MTGLVTGSVTGRLVVVAQIAGAFGVRGEVRIRSFTEDPEACFTYGPLLDAGGSVVLTPVNVRVLNEGFGVQTKERRQREDWEALKGALLHVWREAMPDTSEDEIYVADLVGADVVHSDGRALGKVKAAHNFGAGDLLEIDPPSGPSYMLPFTRDVFPKIDIAGRRLAANPEEDFLPENLQRHASDGLTN